MEIPWPGVQCGTLQSGGCRTDVRVRPRAEEVARQPMKKLPRMLAGKSV